MGALPPNPPKPSHLELDHGHASLVWFFAPTLATWPFLVCAGDVWRALQIVSKASSLSLSLSLFLSLSQARILQFPSFQRSSSSFSKQRPENYDFPTPEARFQAFARPCQSPKRLPGTSWAVSWKPFGTSWALLGIPSTALSARIQIFRISHRFEKNCGLRLEGPESSFSCS